MLKYLMFLFITVISFSIFISCDDTSTGPEVGTHILKIAHFGVDWSEGKAATETDVVENSDGETIGWCPNGHGGGWGQGVWYRSSVDNIYRFGTGSLNDVKSVDTTKWSRDVCLTPLANGDIWVAEALDGYVAFKVIDAPMDSTEVADNPFWRVEVEYKFSTTLGF